MQNKFHRQTQTRGEEGSLDAGVPSNNRKFMRSRVTSSSPNFSDSQLTVHSAMSFYGNLHNTWFIGRITKISVYQYLLNHYLIFCFIILKFESFWFMIFWILFLPGGSTNRAINVKVGSFCNREKMFQFIKQRIKYHIVKQYLSSKVENPFFWFSHFFFVFLHFKSSVNAR